MIQAWNDMQATEAMPSVPPGLGLGAPTKVILMHYWVSTGGLNKHKDNKLK